MNTTTDIMDDEELIFAEEYNEPKIISNVENWKVLIVDDEKEVHRVTKLALNEFEFEGKKIDFISAYTGADAKEIMSSEQNIAVIMLDVVMEEKDSGLKFAKSLRMDLNNHLTRIILRTGQPGDVVNEEQVTFEYDINDYKTKTELTSKKLTTTMLVALRSYRDLIKIEHSKAEITKHKEHLEELVEERTKSLKEAQEQLLISEKMSSVGKFAGGIAHELNSPLVGIYTNIELIAIDATELNIDNIYETKNSIMDNVAIVKNSIKKSRSIISNLLRYTEKSDKKPLNIDVSTIVREVHSAFSEALRSSDINLSVNIEKDWVIKGNVLDIVCAVSNIFDNAIYALNQTPKEEKSIELIATQKDDCNILSITDFGSGIIHDIKTKVFDPFFTTKPLGAGVGLGLTVAYDIIKRHNGTITIDSKPEDYTKVIINFPLNKSTTDEAVWLQ